MKVLQINTVCGRGSTGRIATDLLACLKKTGSSGKIAYGIGPALNAAAEDTIPVGTKLEYYIHNMLSRFTDNEGGYSSLATKRLIGKIREFGPDLVHLHNIHGHYLNYEMLFSFLKESKIPIVWTFHDCWAFTGHCTYFDKAGCEQWKEQCACCSQLRCYPECYTNGNVKRNYERKKASFTSLEDLVIVTPSEWLAGLVKESFFKDHPVKVINNGIDLTKFQPMSRNIFRSRYGLEDKTVMLGVASGWTERKGYSDYIKLAEELSEDQKLVLVGVSEEQLKELPKNIIAIKRTNSVSELAEIYSAADAFLNFTYEDNFPTVNLEAMACGTPVITYKTGGSIESVTPQTGRVVSQGDYRGALEQFEAVKKLDRKLIRDIACGKYAAQDRYAEYIDLYKSMIDARG